MVLKQLYIIGGTMGVGKTAVCQRLKETLPNSVFLDGDWCLDANPFQVTEETKLMVIKNICFLLNEFLHCSAYENVIFCWVLHQQNIIDSIRNNLDTTLCKTQVISLVCRPETLKKRLEKDVQSGIRTSDVVKRSIERIPLYDNLSTWKIHTDEKSVDDIVNIIIGS